MTNQKVATIGLVHLVAGGVQAMQVRVESSGNDPVEQAGRHLTVSALMYLGELQTQPVLAALYEYLRDRGRGGEGGRRQFRLPGTGERPKETHPLLQTTGDARRVRLPVTGLKWAKSPGSRLAATRGTRRRGRRERMRILGTCT